MKISTKGHYGVMAMLDLAMHYGQGTIPLNSIAERQELSESYLEQLFAGLRKAGLVKSVRGAQGGYTLGKDPTEIKVGDIIRVLEGPIAPVECVSSKATECCHRADWCITRNVWEKVKESITDVIDSITLADMVEEAKKVQMKDNFMYYI